ncbi:DUF1453 domain-containing protein [Streptomyces sp. MST-110588]|uniref:DUF1453 domain-containing protein n=1 Tax=Streptomyces sp. MST-110588 TaxID=2833628 RepID=UPI001F5C62E4|nr:DUF1453 domain-containing protein [Streptomyces sp. MST-110588]UNO40612.1 DUF1453 domain-containing protein [Streptomyces sp. MST-110588]
MNGWLLAGIIAAVVVVVVARRLKGERVTLRDLFATPVILVTIGAFRMAHTDTPLTGTDLAWAVPGAVAGTALGALRGTTVRLFDKDGVLWQRYTARTFLVAVPTLVLMAGYSVLAVKMGMHDEARPVQLSIGVSFLGEALVIFCRGRRTGIPFGADKDRRLTDVTAALRRYR